MIGFAAKLANIWYSLCRMGRDWGVGGSAPRPHRPCDDRSGQRNRNPAKLVAPSEHRFVHHPAWQEVCGARDDQPEPIQIAERQPVVAKIARPCGGDTCPKRPKRQQRKTMQRTERADHREGVDKERAHSDRQHRRDPDISGHLMQHVPPFTVERQRPQKHRNSCGCGMDLDVQGGREDGIKGHIWAFRIGVTR